MATLRFFFNLGIEYFGSLQTAYGRNQLLAYINEEIDGLSSIDVDRGESVHSQMAAEFQQMSFESNDGNAQTPHKVNKLYQFDEA